MQLNFNSWYAEKTVEMNDLLIDTRKQKFFY